MALNSTPTSSSLLQFPNLPPHFHIHGLLFTDVRNAPALRSRLISRDPDFEYAFIDASTVLSRTHVGGAVFRAVCALWSEEQLATISTESRIQVHGQDEDEEEEESSLWRVGKGLKTPNVHSEIVLCMSPSNNITEAYKSFGLSDSTTAVVAIKVITPATAASTSKDHIIQHLDLHIEGTRLPLTNENLGRLTDMNKLCRLYKLPSTTTNGASLKPRRPGELSCTDALLVTAIALRGT